MTSTTTPAATRAGPGGPASSSRRALGALVALVAVLVLAPSLAIGGLVLLASDPPAAAAAAPPGGYSSASVPERYQAWVLKAGAVCPVIGPAVIAAQIDTESGWDEHARSPVGAQGPAQFMPGTWPGYGRDDDGNGVASPWDIGDALMAQARFDCALLTTVTGYVHAGLITRSDQDPLDLALAAYNAGPGAVRGAGGIPVNGQTEFYVPKIRRLMISTYGDLLPGVVTGDGTFGSAVLAAAVAWKGTPYSWGGGSLAGPTFGIAQGAHTRGFDCSGLTLFAVGKASQGRIVLSHSADVQAHTGTPVTQGVGSTIDLSLLRVGDLITFAPSAGATFDHVGIYAGNGVMFAAPKTDDVLKFSPLTSSYYQLRYWAVRRLG